MRPVRGQIIGTETPPGVISACLCAIDCYLAQKHHGEIIIGSTTEKVGFDSQELALQIYWRALGPKRNCELRL